jgi:hypothetical protein
MADTAKQLFDIHYLKNADFRTVLATAIYGGVMSNQLINFNICTDRHPIPNKITLEIDPKTSQPGKEFERESRSGIIREVHLGVIMDIATANVMVNWLNEQIKIAEDIKIK